MPLEKIIEEKIREAIAKGEFDNLKGAGKPLNLDDYFAAPEDVRVGYLLLKSNDIVPPEVAWLKEIGELREKVKTVNEAEKSQISKLLNEKTLALTIILERNKRRSKK
jgi:hypothetical protein